MSNNELKARLETILRAAPQLMQVMETARTLDLPDWLVFSGAIYQPVWNHLTGRAADYGIKDYDLGYFDPTDLSYEAEDAVIRLAASAFDEPLRSMVEVRNQARVHLWFEGRFKEPFTPLPNAAEALTRFVAPAFAVGARLESDGSMTIIAPFGLEDMFDMVLRPNPSRPKAAGWAKAVRSAVVRWPELKVIENED
ncbi:nucleotidyltransferase family protein [Caulobacter segnis]|uniref:nucleotidyltransferase family protein n=1 Tax=Caulobacter segnis TaxID=88688 RepID=UPI0024104879|nr:nucleotidyltransferase family protein [Caulobacter segnis]MDG2523703.1 nucleotidyltransferase family protein [Caulobacter segnis]